MLRGKIDRLGNVNVDAIDQQKDLEERNEFLTSPKQESVGTIDHPDQQGEPGEV
jgi:chromosome segregation ATPase